MTKPFKNTEAPKYFTDWAIRNLNATDNKEEFAAAVTKNIRAYNNHESANEIKALLNNFMAELDTHTPEEMLTHYTKISETQYATV